MEYIKKNPSLFIPLLPAFAIAIAYNYEIGYLFIYGIPANFITINTENIAAACSFAFFIVTFCGALFFLVEGIFRVPKKKRLITLRLVLYPILYLFYFLTFELYFVISVLLIGMLLEGLMYLALKRGRRASYDLYYKTLVPPFLVVNFVLALSFAIGALLAQHQALFMGANISDNSADVIIRKYDDYCITKKYNRKESVFENAYSMRTCPTELKLMQLDKLYFKLGAGID